MIKHGVAPYLECSSKGDSRFSAFNARLRAFGGKSIEEIYQAAKVFDDGSTGLHWRKAKGKNCINIDHVRALYSELWDQYIGENPDLVGIIVKATGLSDVFGQTGHACQATELWRIRSKFTDKENEKMESTKKYAGSTSLTDGLNRRFTTGPYDSFPSDDFSEGMYVFDITNFETKLAISEMMDFAQKNPVLMSDQARIVFQESCRYWNSDNPRTLDDIVEYDFKEAIVRNAGRNDELAESLTSRIKDDKSSSGANIVEVIKFIDDLVFNYVEDMKYSGDDEVVANDAAGWAKVRKMLWDSKFVAEDIQRQKAAIRPETTNIAPKVVSPSKFSFSRPRG